MVFLQAEADSFRIEGHTAGVEDGEAWGSRCDIVLDAGWATRSAHVVG